MRLRKSGERKVPLASEGKRQLSFPSRSTELIMRTDNGSPSRFQRASRSSALSSAMLTLDGHSVVQALHERQLLSAASNSVERSASPSPMPRSSSAARMALERPRVDMISSPVATNVGHMVGGSL